MGRQEHVLKNITKTMKGLEIGPSYNPVAPKREGWNLHVLDHASQENLQQKYKHHPVNWQGIEPVDFICADGNFLKAIPAAHHGTYAYIIASHMIEHTVDLLAFLNQMETLLAPNGILSLVVPDKRHCFDFFRPLSTTADILYAHFQKRGTHSIRTAFEHQAYNCSYDSRVMWAEDVADTASFRLTYTLDEAMHLFDHLPDDSSGQYIDFHNWKFTPASFRLILLELQLLEKIRFSTIEYSHTIEGEFYIQLRHQPSALPSIKSEQAQKMRLFLLHQIQAELQEPAATPVQPAAAESSSVVRLAQRIVPESLRPIFRPAYRKLRNLL